MVVYKGSYGAMIYMPLAMAVQRSSWMKLQGFKFSHIE